jgi:DNA repair protein RadC
MTSFDDVPKFDRPREKLAAKGPASLSDAELLAIILGSGIKGKSVRQLASSILRQIDKSGLQIEVAGLVSIEGIGLAKACQIVACFEFARRRLLKDRLCIQSAEDVLPLIAHIADKKQEHFLCVSLNGANEVVGNRLITVGLLTSTQVHPREVFADAVAERAAFTILAHNHPSGILSPTPDDLITTQQLVDAGKILGIPVLDHIIMSKKGYFSFKDNGLI